MLESGTLIRIKTTKDTNHTHVTYTAWGSFTKNGHRRQDLRKGDIGLLISTSIRSAYDGDYNKSIQSASFESLICLILIDGKLLYVPRVFIGACKITKKCEKDKKRRS